MRGCREGRPGKKIVLVVVLVLVVLFVVDDVAVANFAAVVVVLRLVLAFTQLNGRTVATLGSHCIWCGDIDLVDARESKQSLFSDVVPEMRERGARTKRLFGLSSRINTKHSKQRVRKRKTDKLVILLPRYK